MKFDPQSLIPIREYDRLSPKEQDAYDRAHMLHVIRTEGDASVVARYGLETAPIDEVAAAYSNAIDLGALSPAVARNWLIGHYTTRDAELHPEDWPGGPVPVG